MSDGNSFILSVGEVKDVEKSARLYGDFLNRLVAFVGVFDRV